MGPLEHAEQENSRLVARAPDATLLQNFVQVENVKTTKEALAKMVQTKPDLVVKDHGPNSDACKLLHYMNRRGLLQEVPVVDYALAGMLDGCGQKIGMLPGGESDCYRMRFRCIRKVSAMTNGCAGSVHLLLRRSCVCSA
eukprot:1099086-Pelagomonas_calceolata.AAC.1